MATYNPFLDMNPLFTTYKQLEEPEEEKKVIIQNSLFDDWELPGFSRVTNDGIPIANPNTPETIEFDKDILNRMASTHADLVDSETSNDADISNNVNNSGKIKSYSKASKDVMNRAVKAAKYLVNNGNFTKEQASAIVGVMIDENKVDPSSYMKAEKEGKGAKGTGGFGYGAGIGSWTFADNKNALLTAGGYRPNTPIESLSLEDQLRLFVIDSNGRNKKFYDALRRTNNIEDASATAVIITGGVGYSKNWNTHPTTIEAKAMSDLYGRSNDKRFGKSPYHWDLDKRRLNYAKQVLEQLNNG